MKKIFVSAFCLPLLLASCRFMDGNGIKGNGNVITEQRTFTGFTGVETQGSLDVVVSQGDFKIVVEADENIVPHIVTELRNGNLSVHYEEGQTGFLPTSARVIVTAPELKKLIAHGSGNITGTGVINTADEMMVQVKGSGDIKAEINSPSVDAGIAGSGRIILKGTTKDFTVSIKGSGDIEAYDLKAENVKSSIAGSGNAQVFAAVTLAAEIMGSGNVSYKGSPQVKSSSSGSGSVNAAD